MSECQAEFKSKSQKYFIVPELKDYADAARHCDEKGWELATINSPSVIDYLSNKFKSDFTNCSNVNYHQNKWLAGLKDGTWANGKEYDSSLQDSLFESQIIGVNSQKCAVFDPDKAKLLKSFCYNNKYPFLCTRPLGMQNDAVNVVQVNTFLAVLCPVLLLVIILGALFHFKKRHEFNTHANVRVETSDDVRVEVNNPIYGELSIPNAGKLILNTKL